MTYRSFERHSSGSEKISKKEIEMSEIRSEKYDGVAFNVDYKGKNVKISLEYPVIDNKKVRGELYEALLNLYMIRMFSESMQSGESALKSFKEDVIMNKEMEDGRND